MITQPSHATTSGSGTGLYWLDASRLARIIDYVESQSTPELLSAVLGVDNSAAAEASRFLLRHCSFDHVGILLFPTDISEMPKTLIRNGFELEDTMASTIVQRRVCDRYGIRPADLRIHIHHFTRPASGAQRPMRTEIFFPSHDSTPSAIGRMMRADERKHNREAHFAFRVDGDDEAFAMLWRFLTGPGAMRPDGGGYNPNHEGGGCSTFYFASDSVPFSPWPRRLELIRGGYHPPIEHVDPQRIPT
ncbi:hypothetical protein ACIHAX_35710 [Nocardia sp. NPDC051929]|uniref:hypothetical protein n=1 Tax=unclassified Nocardia TaxID=2637762 RepID=UPI0034252DCD